MSAFSWHPVTKGEIGHSRPTEDVVGAGGSLGEENEDEAHQSKIFLFTSWFVVRYRLSGPLGKNLGPHLDLLRERGGVMFEQTLFIPGTFTKTTNKC